VPLFRAFVLALARSGRRWYGRRELREAWPEYAAAHDTASDPAEFEAMLDFHSVSVDEGLTWGVQGALIRFDDFFAVWPFVFHLMHPDLNFLTLLTRRRETLWNETLGADLAKVADWLAGRHGLDRRPR
jgi:hypothetical protein